MVGVGASAGGLKALLALFAELPSAIGLAFVVVQHLDPHQESVLPSLLANGSRLRVREAEAGTRVAPGWIYVITPGTCLTLAEGCLHLAPRPGGSGPHLVIDAFFFSLAADRPGQAIGIVLSGSGTDGTLGLAAIQASGGMTFVQDRSAEREEMPQNAIRRGCADAVLPPAAIAQALIRIAAVGLPVRIGVAEMRPEEPEPIADGDDASDYAAIIAHLRQATGIDFTHYRASTIRRRTLRRMAMMHLATLAEYAAHLDSQPEELDLLARDILIHVTCFYRDRTVFAALQSVIFPALLQLRSDGEPVRLWVVGCSTGQEVYSLAIEMLEFIATSAQASQRIQIFATDISAWALAVARRGCYPDNIADEVPAERLAKYFVREGSEYQVSKAVREICIFAKHDITADTPFSCIDLLSCRNVLIYLGAVLEQQVLPIFHFALNHGGFLLLGSSESLGRSAPLFETVDESSRLYRAIAAPRRFASRASPLPRPNPMVAPLVAPPQLASLSETLRAADEIILVRFAPAAVVVSGTLEIIQYRGATNGFLQPAQGEATLHLLAQVPFGVAEILRDGFAEIRSTGVPVRRDEVPLNREGSFRDVAIEIIPVKIPANATCYLVLFFEAGGSAHDPPAGVLSMQRQDDPGAAIAPRELTQLRRELAAATDYVRILEQLNLRQAEQLKEALEEAQSSTEEFRSTNEELQTTKEEIESTNEELVTINEELRSTNAQLGEASLGLKASGELTAAIIETMRYPLLVLAEDLRVESANLAFFETFCVQLPETIGRLIYDLGNGQWDIPELRRLLEDILPNNSAFDDFEVAHDFGAIGHKTMLLNARRLSGGGDRSRLIVLVIADITERTQIARELQVISDDLSRSNAELDQFASVASHDLQEPLRLMSNYIDLLQRRYGDLFDERAQGYMNYVSNGAQRMSEMIGAVLSYSRLGHHGDAMIPVACAAVLDGALDDLRSVIGEAQAEITLAPLPVVVGDPVQLTQLFQNLISNAVKFRDPGRPLRITIGAREEAREWIFTVADNGVGMIQADHGRIFDLFQRLQVDRDVGGCGIGLATCKKIVEHHHGRLWVESQLGVGSSFHFSLPKERKV